MMLKNFSTTHLQKQLFLRTSQQQSMFAMRSISHAKIPKNHNLLGFIQHYQRNGHLKAKIDPLGLRK